jgi:LTXXQ motif family protein
VPAYGYGGTSNIYGNAESSGDSRRAALSNPIAADVTQSCGGFAPGVTSLPIDQIRREIEPTGEAVAALDQLADATSKASDVLSASCPRELPLTPLARLDAVENRLEAMIKAIQTVRPPLASLYDSLSDEQRQRLRQSALRRAITDVRPPLDPPGPTRSPRYAATTQLALPSYRSGALTS